MQNVSRDVSCIEMEIRYLCLGFIWMEVGYIWIIIKIYHTM